MLGEHELERCEVRAGSVEPSSGTRVGGGNRSGEDRRDSRTDYERRILEHDVPREFDSPARGHGDVPLHHEMAPGGTHGSVFGGQCEASIGCATVDAIPFPERSRRHPGLDDLHRREVGLESHGDRGRHGCVEVGDETDPLGEVSGGGGPLPIESHLGIRRFIIEPAQEIGEDDMPGGRRRASDRFEFRSVHGDLECSDMSDVPVVDAVDRRCTHPPGGIRPDLGRCLEHDHRVV